jgi:hypothetical protein
MFGDTLWFYFGVQGHDVVLQELFLRNKNRVAEVRETGKADILWFR